MFRKIHVVLFVLFVSVFALAVDPQPGSSLKENAGAALVSPRESPGASAAPEPALLPNCVNCDPNYSQVITPTGALQTASGTVPVGDAYTFGVRMCTGTTYILSLCPSHGGSAGFDTYMCLFAPGCGALLYQADDTCGLQSEMYFTPPSDGIYILQIEGSRLFYGGQFTLGYVINQGPGCLVTCQSDADCDDGMFCDGQEFCNADHICQAGTAPTCDDGDPCTIDFCSAATDQCVHQFEDLQGPDIVCTAEKVTKALPSRAGSSSSDGPKSWNPPRTLTREELLETLLPLAPDEEARKALTDKLSSLPERVTIYDGDDPGFAMSGGDKTLSCSTPCTGGVLTNTSNPFYKVALNCGTGSYTAGTGPSHPDGPNLNVIFGGSSLSPGTSQVTFHVHNNNTDYLNPGGGQACVFDPADTAHEPDNHGVEAEWTKLPVSGLTLHLREEIVAFGTNGANSGVRLTLCTTNDVNSTVTANMGVRWQIDYQNGGDDGPWYAPVQCFPFEIGDPTHYETEFTPSEIEDFFQIKNNEGTPIFGNYTNTTSIVGFPGTGKPDRLVYGRWPSLTLSPWNYVTQTGQDADFDSAVLYYFGYLPANGIQIAPGQSFCRSVVIFTAGEAQSCGAFEPGEGENAEVTVCPGEEATLGATATDNCGTPTVTLFSATPGAPVCSGNPCTMLFTNPGTYVYTWRAEDSAGNTTDCQSTVIVLEPDDPSCNQPPSCNAGGPYTSLCREALISGATVSDPNGDGLTYSWTSSDPDVSVVPNSGSIPPGVTNPGTQVPTSTATLSSSRLPCGVTATLTLTVNDGQETSTCEATVIFDDNVPPAYVSPPQNLTVECSSVPPPPAQTATDNCDMSVTITYDQTQMPRDCPDNYYLTRRWTATDDCSNSTPWTEIITVRDTTPPVLSGVPANVTVECNSVPLPATPTATDNCDTTVTITYNQVQTPGNCQDNYTLTRTWTATDNCSNSSIGTQVITVRDTTPPVFSGGPANVTVECNNVPAPVAPTATDNCDTSVIITYEQFQAPGNCPDNYILTRRWTATDNCSNSITWTQLITVQDTTPPVFSGVPADVTVECSNVPPPATPTATDNCDTSVTITYNQVQTPGNCPDSYTLTRTWTATDNCNNSATRTQVVTVRDTTPPVLSGVPANVTVECDSVPPPAVPTATDNCDTSVTITYSQTRTDGNCPDNYTLTRVWTATDNCNNSMTGTQVITVRDTTPPVLSAVPADVTVECDSVPPPAVPTAVDNCDTSVTITYSQTRADGNCPDSYTLTRRWTATDNCNNSTTGTQVITVRDTTPPVLSGVRADATVECDSVPEPAVPTAVDNCDASVDIAYSQTRADGNCPYNYTLTRVWTATDNCANFAIGTQVLTVQDTTAPRVTCSFEPVLNDEETDEEGDASHDEYVEGLFTVHFSGTDNCDPNPTVHGYLDVFGNDETCDDENPDFIGYPVNDGDRVRLNCSKKAGPCTVSVSIPDEEGDSDEVSDVAVEITGPAMRLIVTGEDVCLNKSQTECIHRCPDPEGCIDAITLRNSAGEQKTFYWYEFTGPDMIFEVGGETGEFHVSCSKCLRVGDVSGTLTITCIQGGPKLEKKCKVPEGTYSAPCP